MPVPELFTNYRINGKKMLVENTANLLMVPKGDVEGFDPLFEQIKNQKIIVFEPHPDDAILSCGEIITAWRKSITSYS